MWSGAVGLELFIYYYFFFNHLFVGRYANCSVWIPPYVSVAFWESYLQLNGWDCLPEDQHMVVL